MSVKEYEASLISKYGLDFLKEIKKLAIQDADILYDIISGIESENPTLLEIGRFKGYSMGLMFHAKPKAYIISCDPVLYKEALRMIMNTVNAIFLLTSDDISNACIKLDFALIDGDHKYESAKKDYDNILPLMNPGGIIVFDNLNHPCGCGKAFKETRHPHKEIKGNLGIIRICPENHIC